VSQRARFADGSLVDEWHGSYPDIFDEDDYRLARSQPGNHFFEWLAAVLFRESTGYYSLIEKYETAKHAGKVAKFKEIVNPAVFEFAMTHRAGLPDLFVYQPGTPNWFFCEVKGGSDRLSPGQRERHDQLESITKTQVRILWLRKI
jgi:hypothetical protein